MGPNPLCKGDERGFAVIGKIGVLRPKPLVRLVFRQFDDGRSEVAQAGGQKPADGQPGEASPMAVEFCRSVRGLGGRGKPAPPRNPCQFHVQQRRNAVVPEREPSSPHGLPHRLEEPRQTPSIESAPSPTRQNVARVVNADIHPRNPDARSQREHYFPRARKIGRSHHGRPGPDRGMTAGHGPIQPLPGQHAGLRMRRVGTRSAHCPLEDARPRLAHGQGGGEHQGAKNPATSPLPKQGNGEHSQTRFEQRVAAQDRHQDIEHRVDHPAVEPLEEGIIPTGEQFHHCSDHADSASGWPET